MRLLKIARLRRGTRDSSSSSQKRNKNVAPQDAAIHRRRAHASRERIWSVQVRMMRRFRCNQAGIGYVAINSPEPRGAWVQKHPEDTARQRLAFSETHVSNVLSFQLTRNLLRDNQNRAINRVEHFVGDAAKKQAGYIRVAV